MYTMNAQQPPPPKLPHPSIVLTEEEQDQLPPGQLVDMTRELLERTLGFHVVEYPGPYLMCFTHKSVSNYYKRPSYERLEFLGDAVINFTVAKFLFDAYPEFQEGMMSKVRTRLTRSETLAYLARCLQLDRFIFMSGKGLYRGWNKNTRILEDCMEAMVGAVYLDMGMAQAKNFFLGLVDRFIDMSDMLKDRNYKDLLMRTMHARAQPLPVYECETVVNAEKKLKHFRVSVTIDGHIGIGMGRTKKSAEQEAAKGVLLKLGIEIEE